MVKILNPKRYTLNAGFTLVETLVSLLIFSIALTAIFYLLSKNLNEASLIKNNFIASIVRRIGSEKRNGNTNRGTGTPIMIT